ncbi:hypothetical protein EXIGLDRAFT_261316 [Exidia glandulosa HHB12029]|uniref:Uncharacterized protein n=1 Tax=Exidia glandulosa HHB12029 TaxID=1314781 RepID=A0A165DU67_EXIGL|nr:hypothetical protein EXIGLDRAFT_261316 [Exidia glandulosa HHB12029]
MFNNATTAAMTITLIGSWCARRWRLRRPGPATQHQLCFRRWAISVTLQVTPVPARSLEHGSFPCLRSQGRQRPQLSAKFTHWSLLHALSTTTDQMGIFHLQASVHSVCDPQRVYLPLSSAGTGERRESGGASRSRISFSYFPLN